jgi:hypothetical protein
MAEVPVSRAIGRTVPQVGFAVNPRRWVVERFFGQDPVVDLVLAERRLVPFESLTSRAPTAWSAPAAAGRNVQGMPDWSRVRGSVAYARNRGTSNRSLRAIEGISM